MSFDLLDFHERAVRTPSHEDVAEMRELLGETLRGAGVDPRVDGHGNLLASRGSGDPHLVFNTHVDTVAPHVAFERDGDVVRGRGACDAKGPLAALLGAFLDADPAGTLTLAVTPDEETLQTGAAALAGTLDADGYVVGEPTDLDVCTAARGQFEGTVALRGESGHAADPASGANAVAALEGVLSALRTYDEIRGPVEHETLGPPTLTPTMVEGGEAPNRIPERCVLTFDRRSVPPETSESFPESLSAHLADTLADGVDAEVSLVRPDTPFPEAFATDADAPLVERLAAASGGDVRPFGAATEASHFAAHAPTVVFGPGVLADESGPVAHSDREYVRRSDVVAARDALRELSSA